MVGGNGCLTLPLKSGGLVVLGGGKWVSAKYGSLRGWKVGVC